MATKNEQINVSEMMAKLRNDLSLPDEVFFFDTTLRDGEQTPGISFSLDEKISIAENLDALGINVIEAGFPIVSDVEAESCKKIASLGLNSEVIGLARLQKADIDKVVECDMDSIHVFIATSDLHLQNKLKMTREAVLETITEYVAYAKDHYKTVEFSAEDATRTDLDFLIQANQTAIDAGATRINIPDTVGTISPYAYGHIIKKNYEALPKDVRISLHCHNDFGLAVANSLAGVENGASQIHTTILGLGERAGNAAFEETAMSLYALYQVPMGINTKRIYPTARLVEGYCGGKVTIGRLTPLVGKNAFAHESGIHVHAMLSNARTYEPITPELLGLNRTDNIEDIVKQSVKMGKHTGGHALKAKLEELGMEATAEQFGTIMGRIKSLGSKGHEIHEEDFLAIVKDALGQIPEAQKMVFLDELTVLTGSITPTSTVRLRVKNNGDFISRTASAVGVGPVDAASNAIVKCFGEVFRIKLQSFGIDAVTGGTDALGHVTISVLDLESNEIFTSSATHEDIVMSSVLALISTLNKIALAKQNEK